MNVTCAVIHGRCPWSAGLQINGWRDVTGNPFSLFCSTWRAVLKMFMRLFRIKASESLEKKLARTIYKEEKWRKGALYNLRMPKLATRNLHNIVPSCVIATRDSLFCKVFSPLFCFEQEKTLKIFSKKLYTTKIKKSLVFYSVYWNTTIQRLGQKILLHS